MLLASIAEGHAQVARDRKARQKRWAKLRKPTR